MPGERTAADAFQIVWELAFGQVVLFISRPISFESP